MKFLQRADIWVAERLDRTQEVGGSSPPSSIARIPHGCGIRCSAVRRRGVRVSSRPRNFEAARDLSSAWAKPSRMAPPSRSSARSSQRTRVRRIAGARAHVMKLARRGSSRARNSWRTGCFRQLRGHHHRRPHRRRRLPERPGRHKRRGPGDQPAWFRRIAVLRHAGHGRPLGQETKSCTFGAKGCWLSS